MHTAPGGDFNYINDHTLDRKGGNLIVTKQYKHIGTCDGDILAECHLKDIRRTKNPNKKSYTCSTRVKSIQSRLDYMYTSEHAVIFYHKFSAIIRQSCYRIKIFLQPESLADCGN